MLVVGHQGCAGAPVGRTPAGDPPSAERGLPHWATEFKNARQPFLNPSRIPLPGIMPLCTLQFPATGAARGPDATGVQGGAPFSSTVQNLYKGCYENFGPAPLSPVVVRPIPRRRASTGRRSVLQRIARSPSQSIAEWPAAATPRTLSRGQSDVVERKLSYRWGMGDSVRGTS